MRHLSSRFKWDVNFCVRKYRRMSPYHGSSTDMMNRKSSGRSFLGGGEVVDGGISVMSAASASAFMLFGETNSKSNS